MSTGASVTSGNCRTQKGCRADEGGRRLTNTENTELPWAHWQGWRTDIDRDMPGRDHNPLPTEPRERTCESIATQTNRHCGRCNDRASGMRMTPMDGRRQSAQPLRSRTLASLRNPQSVKDAPGRWQRMRCDAPAVRTDATHVVSNNPAQGQASKPNPCVSRWVAHKLSNTSFSACSSP